MATFAVPYIIASEVAKYWVSEFDTEQLLLGRKNFYERAGDWLFVAESSPIWTDDPFGKMCSAVKTHVYPYLKLTCCGSWLFIDDNHLEVGNDANNKPLRDVEYIKNNPDSVYLRCPNCKGQVFERDHYPMLQNVIYAQNPDQIINDTQPDFAYVEEIVIHWNKLLNPGYRFNQCLADFFHATNQLDGGIALRTYQRETMGRFMRRGEVGDDLPTSAGLDKTKPYTIYTPTKYPRDIKFLIAGHDTHKDRITAVVRGFTGQNTDTYLVAYEEIEHDILADKKIAFEQVRDRIYAREYITESGRKLPILRGVIDAADGNTSGLAKFIADRITYNGHKILKTFRGSAQRNPTLIEWHDKSKCYFGHTESLSKIVWQLVNQNNWFLPTDTPQSYLTQLMGENSDGKKISDNNHVRSCENYIQSQAHLIEAYNPGGKWVEEIARIKQPANEEENGLVDLVTSLM